MHFNINEADEKDELLITIDLNKSSYYASWLTFLSSTMHVCHNIVRVLCMYLCMCRRQQEEEFLLENLTQKFVFTCT